MYPDEPSPTRDPEDAPMVSSALTRDQRRAKDRARRTPLCVAPLADGAACGAVASHEREVEGLVCALCAKHAAELDEEMAN